MGIINKLFKKKEIEQNKILKKINNSFVPQRYCLLIFGIFLSAFSFNMFYAPYNIVTDGLTGVSLLFRYWFNIDPSLFVLIISLLLIILSLIFLGFKTTLKTIVGTLLLPIFMEATELLTSYFNFGKVSLFLISIYGGVLSGLASGIILKTGYSKGGFHILYQIMNKYLNISMGKCSRIINTIIIGASVFIFGLDKAMYAIIALFISTFIMDKVLLGVSNSKCFYIVTKSEKEITEYIVNNLSHSVTIIDSKGGYTNKGNKVLMCVIPTKEYYNLKEVVLGLDNDAFFLITDAYEVEGGY